MGNHHRRGPTRSNTQGRRLDQVEETARAVLIDLDLVTGNGAVTFTVHPHTRSIGVSWTNLR